MKKTLEQSLQKNEILVRGLFMLFFTVIFSISKFLVIGIMLFQFFTILITEKPNEQLRKFSHGLGVYICQIIQFLAFSSEQRPFPFSQWPDSTLPNTSIENNSSNQTPV